MLSATRFREIVTGSDNKLSSRAARAVFAMIEPIYATVVRIRNRRFDRGIGVERVDVPVISVGNLTLGGTGKTPMVEWVARWFLDRGVRVAIVSRGYGATEGASNDEAKELAEKLPDVPHVLNRKRVVGAREAIASHGAQLILLDDGFQHRRLARDLDLVLVDALEPFGFEHVFPRGTLREPLVGFARADVIALSRADAVDQKTRDAIRERIGRYNPTANWLELVHRPKQLRAADGNVQRLESLRDQRILAFCGIGNPSGFRHVLDNCGYVVAELQEFADHYAYQPADVSELGELAKKLGAAAILCTHKDLVKVGAAAAGGVPIWALEIGMEVQAGLPAFERRLEAIAAKSRR